MSRLSWLAIILFAFPMWTASAMEGGMNDSIPPARKEKLNVVEKSFNPSEYDITIEPVRKKAAEPLPSLNLHVTAGSALPETAQGFRIQMLTTNSYDEAVDARDKLDAMFPNDWVYMVYDAPAYKIRIGDYLNRAQANLALEAVVRKGYRGVWIVPDRIIINQSVKPPLPVPSDSLSAGKK